MKDTFLSSTCQNTELFLIKETWEKLGSANTCFLNLSSIYSIQNLFQIHPVFNVVRRTKRKLLWSVSESKIFWRKWWWKCENKRRLNNMYQDVRKHGQSCAGSQREGPWVKGWRPLLSSDSHTTKGGLLFEFTFFLRQHVHHVQQHSNYTHNSSCCEHCNSTVKFHHMEIPFWYWHQQDQRSLCLAVWTYGQAGP